MKKYLKQVSLLLLLALCIISLKENKTYAYSYSELNEYLDYYLQYSGDGLWPNDKVFQTLVTLRNLEPAKFSQIFENNIQLGSSFSFIYANMSSGNYWIRINTLDSNRELSINGTRITGYGTSYVWQKSSGTWTSNTNSNYSFNFVKGETFIYSTATTAGTTLKDYISTNKNDLNTQQQYTYAIPIKENQPQYTNGESYINAFNIRKGQVWTTSDITILVYTIENSALTQKVVDYDFLNPNNDNEIIVRLKTSDLDNDNTYYIRLVYNGIIWQQSNGQRIVVGYGDNGTTSGDNGNGNGNGTTIDTTGIENKLNLINSTIKSGDNTIISKLNEQESGEKARFNFWKNVYEGMFTLSSGDIYDLNNKIEEKLDLENITDASEQIEFFEDLANVQPGDFKISWKPITYNNMQLIPSGDVNFSAWARQNETFTQVHKYLQLIMTGSLAIIILRSIWKTICIMAGIGMEVYETAEEENAVIETHHDTINYDNNTVQSSVTYRKGRNSLTTRGKVKPYKRL